MVFISKYLIPKGYNGLTIFPFVFLKNEVLKEDSIVMNHEKIHLRQQIELLVIPFYMVYFLEFLIRLTQYRNWHKAYRSISFEREAYANEHHLDYLNKRSFWSFLKYLRTDDF
jgi:hypothetical protein